MDVRAVPSTGPSALPLNVWSHLAATFNGTNLRLYVNGVEVSSAPRFGQIGTSTGALTIGGDALYGQHFAGRIDEVRIFNTARSASEIQTDMNTPIGNPAPDTQAPTAPSGLSATAVSGSQINLAWTASTDNVGVSGYRVERCQGAGCSDFVQVATPTGTTFNNTGLAAGTSYSYRVRAADAAGNLSGYSSVQSATTQAPDTQAPTVPAGLTATAVSASQINLAWTASTDNVGVTGYRVERCQGAGCSNFVQVATPGGTTHNDTGLGGGDDLRYRVRAADAAGNLSDYSTIQTATTQAGPDTQAADGADRADRDAGFSQPDQPHLDRLDRQRRCHRLPGRALPGRDVHELRPGRDPDRHDFQQHGSGRRDDLPVPGAGGGRGRKPERLLERAERDHAAGSRHAGAEHARRIHGDRCLLEPDQPRLDRLDRQRRRDRIPGRALPGRRLLELRPGRDPDRHDFQQHGAGRGDDLPVPGAGGGRGREPERLLGRADSDHAGCARHAGADGAGRPDGDAVSASQINLAWTASTDNVGVTGYRVERCQGAGCSDFVQVATPTGTTFNNTGLAAGTSYSYRVRAADAAGNLSGYSSVQSATTQTPDTQAPTVPAGLTATAVSASQINLAWTASTDNVGVTGYRVERCQGAGCYELRPDRDAERNELATTPAWLRRRATATGCGRPMRPPT